MTINLTDPANHPANSPLTGERIERVIEALESSLQYRNGSSMDHFIADAVKGLRELRESREAVPVAWRYRYVHTPKSEEHGSHFTTDWVFCDSEDECNPSDCFERQALYAAPPSPVVPDMLPCPVFLEPGLKFGKGVSTQCMLDALNRRAEYHAELDAMTPEQRAEHDAGIAEFKAMLGGGFRDLSTPVDPQVAEYEEIMNQAIPDNSFTNEELEAMAHGNNPQANAYRELLARRNSPVTPDGWKVEAERLAELHGCSFVVFRHGEEPQCADPTKVIISFTDKGLGYADAASSPTARAVIRDEMKMGARLTNHRFKP
ncbi:hypothetical protein [Kluyvera sichuanensis]|uniref:hypothetical protein n=1 Tax=Kluyvera sichuanensis TaxID=2725494 RepID=UPI001CC72CC9|nr:hypothetical protein [Kluyvera sichuanensis]